jgi:hypothetical protein
VLRVPSVASALLELKERERLEADNPASVEFV